MLQNEAAGILVVVLLIIIIPIVLWVWCAIWVYKDAKSRGKEAIIWVLIVLVMPVVGLIIYLIVRNEPETARVMYPPPQYYYPPPPYYQQPQYQPQSQPQYPQQYPPQYPQQYPPQYPPQP
jgi:hypothetical protein